MRDFIVAETEYRDRRFLAAALYEDGKLSELDIRPWEENSLVDRIYVGCLDRVVRNIGGAFLRFSGDEICFLPGWKSSMNAGHLLVQISRDAVDRKNPTARASLSVAGRLAVVKTGRGLAFSGKLTDEEKALLRKWTEGLHFEDRQVLLRTNAAAATKAEVLGEIARLSARWDRMLADAEKATPGTCVYRPDPFYIEMLRDLRELPDRVFTDVPAVAARLMEEPALLGGERTEEELMVKNRSLTLAQLYSLPHDLDKLTNKVAWLPCGGYLVIERTEAFISIDVNTGKCARGRIPEENYRRINLEAAAEALRQVRLRNLAGMVLIDFINLENKDHQEELISVTRKLARRELVPVEVVDLTPLGIMECVRKRGRAPLAEVLGGRTESTITDLQGESQ